MYEPTQTEREALKSLLVRIPPIWARTFAGRKMGISEGAVLAASTISDVSDGTLADALAAQKLPLADLKPLRPVRSMLVPALPQLCSWKQKWWRCYCCWSCGRTSDT